MPSHGRSGGPVLLYQRHDAITGPSEALGATTPPRSSDIRTFHVERPPARTAHTLPFSKDWRIPSSLWTHPLAPSARPVARAGASTDLGHADSGVRPDARCAGEAFITRPSPERSRPTGRTASTVRRSPTGVHERRTPEFLSRGPDPQRARAAEMRGRDPTRHLASIVDARHRNASRRRGVALRPHRARDPVHRTPMLSTGPVDTPPMRRDPRERACCHRSGDRRDPDRLDGPLNAPTGPGRSAQADADRPDVDHAGRSRRNTTRHHRSGRRNIIEGTSALSFTASDPTGRPSHRAHEEGRRQRRRPSCPRASSFSPRAR